MISLWGDSDFRSSSISSLRLAASSPAPAIVVANRPAIPKPPINGPLSPTPSVRAVPLLAPQSRLSSGPTSPDNVASDGDDTANLVAPPSPPDSEIRVPAVDRIMSFVHQRGPFALQEVQETSTFSMMQEFHNIVPSTYDRILRELECKLFEYHPKVRIDYFGDLSRLVITIPGEAHELVADNAQYHLRQSLFDQGFYWPEWGGKIDRIEYTGSANRTLTRPGQNSSIFQPDGSLKIAGLNLPFLIIEVADTESYQHARTKSKKFLMGSKGKTRFVILIDLVRKSRKEMDEMVLNDGPESDDPGEPLPAQLFPEGNKRAAQGDDNSPGINKRTRTTSPQHSPTLPPLLPRAPYSRATVTVLTTRIIDHPRLTGQKLRTMDKLIDAAECWPAMPAQDVCFSFSWDDMNVANYPAELQDRKFTVRFEWLNELLQSHFGVLRGLPTMLDDTGDVMYDDESEDSEDAAIERKRLWAVEANVESGKVESDDSWK